MSFLSRWLGAPPPAKKTKTSQEIQQSNQIYEKTKRQRSFQKDWKDRFHWLDYSEESKLMKCTICIKYDKSVPPGTFVTGTSNYKIDMLRRHEGSETHIQSLQRHTALTSKPGSSCAEKSLLTMNKAAASKLVLLMRNAHFIAKLGKPYTEFVAMCHLDTAKGIDIGQTYISDKYCQKFIASIADIRRAEQKEILNKAAFISVISDGATDCSSKETEIVYVRTSIDCELSTLFAGLKHVGKGDADTITRAITNVLDNSFPDNWRTKIVAMGTDGASVMVGKKGGVVKKMADGTERPFLKGIHCSAHRLELAYKDAIKTVPLHQKVELLLLNLYLFYKYSPLNRSNLRATFASMETPPRIPTRMGGTRWLPHTKRALKQMQQNPAKESSCKAKGFLKLLQEPSVQYWLHFMADVVKCLSKVTETIQEKDSNVGSIFTELEGAKAILAKYKTRYYTKHVIQYILLWCW
ncbi:zinc finger protein 862-like isoform X2 [Argopecten irradians]|uniref:zinc finger protein 862-like isoform X2 n=1 Tax=Argopecten irradians TaxID=31199 RepID=UPI00371BDFE8